MSEFATLAHHYQPDKETDILYGWYMSRKLNGWRCLWDGGLTRGKPLTECPWSRDSGSSTGLWTLGRSSGPKPIFAPTWFLNTLPVGMPLDGELWANDDLGFIKSVCGQGPKWAEDVRWHAIKYCVFDYKPFSCWPLIGNTEYQYNVPWWARFEHLKQLEQLKQPIITVIEQLKITSLESIKKFADFIVSQGGEGIMLRNPAMIYELKRSHNLLKVKKFYEAEAVIIDYVGGLGKHEGRMGSIECSITWDDKILSVQGGTIDMVGRKVEFGIGGGFTDEQREWSKSKVRWPIGGTIHFSYLGVTKDGIPFSCNQCEG